MQIAMSMEYAAYVSPAYLGMAAREHAMSAPGSDAHGDSGDKNRYGVPHSAAKRDGCATTDISGATHGDGVTPHVSNLYYYVNHVFKIP
jgi:hypothetical protein